MASSFDVLISAEQSGGVPRRMATELATKARQLAAESGGKVSAVLVGPGARAAAEKLGDYGVDRAFVSEDERFLRFPVVAESAVIGQAVELAAPSLLLFGATNLGRDLSGRLSARLGVGVITGATDVHFAEGSAQVECPVFGGTVDELKGFAGDRGIVLLRPNAVAAEKAVSVAPVSIQELEASFGSDRLVEVIETVVEGRGSVLVEEASVIVSGGRGLGGPEPFRLLEELAAELGGAVGSTRPAVDSGWMDYSTQIGQTGKTVKPKLYIACGVSGAVQHRVGMQTSGIIVAINKNQDAAIFRLADFGVVGDLFEIVPKLTREIRRMKGGGAV